MISRSSSSVSSRSSRQRRASLRISLLSSLFFVRHRVLLVHVVLHSTFSSTLVENACQTLYNTHMETQTRIGAKEFFLQIGAMVALYAGAIALLNLLFTVINYAFPQVDQYRGYSYYYSNPISFPVSTLIIVFSLFLFLSWVIQKSYETNPS